MLDCLSAGILVVDHLTVPISHLPRAGELVMADELPLSIGGNAANVSMNLARLGVKVGAVGCVGDDVFGQFAVQTLQQGGVDVRGVRILVGIATAATLIINVKGEDRRFIHAAGANAALTADGIPSDLVRQCKVFYVGGYLLMPALERRGTLVELFRQARAAGAKTILDVVVPGPGDHWHKFEEILTETDVFLPNSDEAELITGLADPLAQAERFRAAGTKTVVITRGEQGTLLIEDGRRIQAGVYPTSFVGGTGAGDAFDAGFIAGMLAGEDSLGCLRWGSALGASCVRSVSATESVFDRREALEFMRRHELRIQEC
ncbi:MAG: carbohydrate kinase family protein [Pirellulales bacterium]